MVISGFVQVFELYEFEEMETENKHKEENGNSSLETNKPQDDNDEKESD